MSRPYAGFIFSCILLLYGSAFPVRAAAGATNPNISVLGQFLVQNTDDESSENAHHTTLNLAETELVFDAYLNPYAKGWFVFSVGDEGLETEEAYVTVFNGLPGTLNLKGGKYRIGFGKLNPQHPHTYPFIMTPRAVTALLPGGDEGYNDTGIQGSLALPTRGSWSSVISADALNGAPFHPEQPAAAAAWAGRWSNALLINDEVPLELGLSGTQGTNDTLWQTRTGVYGADVKAKIAFSPQENLTLQGEYFYNSSDVLVDSTTGAFNPVLCRGWYAFANLAFCQRWNAGLLYDQYEPAENPGLTNRTVTCFAGYALLEETTLVRLACEQFIPQDAAVVHTWRLQVLFSMGPHKAHQF